MSTCMSAIRWNWVSSVACMRASTASIRVSRSASVSGACEPLPPVKPIELMNGQISLAP